MRRFLHPNILVPTIVGLILFILMPILYFTGVIGPNDTKDPVQETETTISAEAEIPEQDELKVEEETFLLENEKEIAEAMKNNPEKYPGPAEDHEHAYNSTVISPSCNRQGYTLYTCECGDEYKDDVTDKLAHNYSSQVISPTTESGGYTLHTCTICGKEYKDTYTDPIKTAPEPTKPQEPTTKPTEPKPTEPKPTEPTETTEPATTEPIQSEKAEANVDPGNADLNDSRNDDFGDCPKCGRKLWTYQYQTGCFTFLVDSTCDCGAFVKAGECHHH